MKRILIVDDEKGMLDLLAMIFSRSDFEVRTAESGDDAMALLTKESFDMIVTDVRMPGKRDGIDLMYEYREIRPAQKMILITGYAVEGKLEKAIQEPHTGYMSKPFEVEELIQMVTRLLAS